MDNKILNFKDLRKASKAHMDDSPLVSVALLGDTATQFLTTAITGSLKLAGFNVEIFEGEYNQVERQILDPTSEFYEFNAKFNIIFQSSHKLLEKYNLMEVSQWDTLAEERISFIRTICENVPGKIIYYNYPEIDDMIFGSYANSVRSSFIYQLRKLNFELMNLSQEFPNLYICDIASIQNTLGRDKMFDSSVYVSTEMVLSLDALPYVASRTTDIIGSIEGKFKKCVILDLDNTLWGGIVGDDGWENLQLGHSLGIGKVFSEFQEWVKKLKTRGIIVCICSKNDETVAKEAFEKNPDMVLRLGDISVFIANWDNKADNIRSIQRILNIGFDSMVFIDDNPFERNIVRENIPEIHVPELPEDPGDYLEFLYKQNLFETASFSAADKDRTSQYQIEAKRVASAKKFTNEADYLKSLCMVSEVTGFTTFNTPRVAQLSQRSNQFNLRTVRYTEDEIKEIESDSKKKGFAFSLKDKFGDNGLIAVVILSEIDTETLFIDTWFMSCRVLKRGMENFTLNIIVDWARKNGYSRIVGEYLPTQKNKMVENHYEQLGFLPLETASTSSWYLDIADYTYKECYILKENL